MRVVGSLGKPFANMGPAHCDGKDGSANPKSSGESDEHRSMAKRTWVDGIASRLRRRPRIKFEVSITFSMVGSMTWFDSVEY